MSQTLNNRPDESGNNSERGTGENRERVRYEGFEGMNYEQKRPSYPPQTTTGKNEINRGSKGKRRDEL
jgi:hypothetical protein